MKLKSYFSATVQSAMELARKELGDDALLVNARPSSPETRYLGAYEVVFGVLPESPEPPPASPAQAQTQGMQQFSDELAELRRQVDRLMLSPAPTSAPRSPSLPAPVDELAGQEVEPLLAERLLRGEPLQDLVRVDSNLGPVVALIGPPGMGKTTTLIKLAARFAVAGRRTCHILTTDVARIAAADQLRTLAALLGVGCTVVETPAALSQALDEHSAKDLILIDTPGFSFSEADDAAELGAAFASRPDLDTHLVLPASMKAADLRRVADFFARFRPSKLLFTRLDETSRYGALASEANRTGLPLSFFTTGQQIPRDIEAASIDRLRDLIGLSRPAPLRMGAAA